MTVHKQNCNRNNPNPQAALCGPKEVLSTVGYPMRLREHFHNCVTLYGHGSNRVFAVSDRDPDDFEVEHLAGFAFVPSAGLHNGDRCNDPRRYGTSAANRFQPAGAPSRAWQ